MSPQRKVVANLNYAFPPRKLLGQVSDGATGFLSDAAKFFWDNTAKRLGIGTNAPAATLDVNGEIKAGNTNLACSATTKGSIRYNNTSSVLEFCNGTSWNLVQAAACTDATPSSFTFTDESNSTASTLYTSNIVQVSGLNCTVPITVSGVGSPQLQICSDAVCGTVVQGWTSSSSSIVSGQYLQLRQTSDAAGGATTQATVIAGGKLLLSRANVQLKFHIVVIGIIYERSLCRFHLDIRGMKYLLKPLN